jgi:hypothetical protein
VSPSEHPYRAQFSQAKFTISAVGRYAAFAGCRNHGRYIHQSYRQKHHNTHQEITGFTTAADFQTAVTIHVLQGERQMASDNVSLGMFNLEGIHHAQSVPKSK